MPALSVSAIRGRLLTFLAQPQGAGDTGSYRYVPDGMVLAKEGRISAVGPASEIAALVPPAVAVDHYPDMLIMPGFIDLHIHFPQTQVIASYGAQLMDWLEKYTFVEEQKFADPAHAAAMAHFFLGELLRNGTTSACVYGSAHPASIEAFFAESERRGTLMIGGTAIMNRNGPQALLDAAKNCYQDTKDLIARWHRRGRQRYAVTPRFAITSTEAQLEETGQLLRDFPDVYLQTHLDENRIEIETVRELFPADANYTSVYARFGLMGPRSLFGHCIHLEESEADLLAESASVAVFCPTSNLFIGSGLFDYRRLAARTPPVRIGLGTDVGGGTSYSMLRTSAEAYKIMQLQGQNLPALTAFDLMTRRNAEALSLAGEIGTLVPGAWADLVVLDARATPAMAHRMEIVRGDLEEELFVLMTLGDDRSVRATYVQGGLAQSRPALS